MGRLLMLAGAALVLAGAFWTFGERFGLGHLPGDLEIKGERYAVHFPVMTCLLLSAGVSALWWVIKRLLG